MDMASSYCRVFMDEASHCYQNDSKFHMFLSLMKGGGGGGRGRFI